MLEPSIRLSMLHIASEVFRAMAPTAETEGKIVKARELGEAIADIAAVLEDYYLNGKLEPSKEK